MRIKVIGIVWAGVILAVVSCTPEEPSEEDSAPSEIERLMQWAGTGNTEAAYQLGLLYAEKGDYKKAFEWMKRAAEDGNVLAQYNMGLMYQEGLGTSRDFEKAAGWYAAAAQQGLREARVCLGWMYEVGRGVEKDNAAAMQWYLWAGENALRWSPFAKGIFYTRGHHQAVDMKQALVQLMLAEAHDYDVALLKQQAGLHLSAEEIEESRLIAEGQLKTKEPALYYTRQAKTGEADAMYELGVMYQEGWWVQKDYNAAFGWFARLAEQGDRRGQYKLGLFYDEGYGRPEDDQRALLWYRKSADQGYRPAHQKLADLGVADSSEAIQTLPAEIAKETEPAVVLVPMSAADAEWYHQAAEEGDRDGQYQLGLMYQSGLAVEKNAAEAVKWFVKAADHGHSQARKKLAEMYYWGEGISKDPAEAWKWLLLTEDYGIDTSALRGKLETEITAEQKEEGRRRAEAYKGNR